MYTNVCFLISETVYQPFNLDYVQEAIFTAYYILVKYYDRVPNPHTYPRVKTCVLYFSTVEKLFFAGHNNSASQHANRAESSN